MTEIDNENTDESLESESVVDAPVVRRNPFRVVAWLLGSVLLIAVVLVIIQSFLQPDIPEEMTQSAKISEGGGASIEDISLSANAITRKISQAQIDEAEHPLDPMLVVAKELLRRYDENVQDYVAILQKQVRVDGKLQPEGFMTCKIREKRTDDGKEIPFSVYTYFLKPKKLAGQEAIWVEGRNEGKLVAHAQGIKNVVSAWLPPDGAMAMEGNLHPIYLIGMRNLIDLMIKKGTRDRKHDECEVTITRNVTVGEHVCTRIDVLHPVERDYFEFHLARIYIDDQRELPIGYEAYLWPEKPGEEPPLLESYFYNDIKLNQGLTDLDFDHRNELYSYPRFELYKPKTSD